MTDAELEKLFIWIRGHSSEKLHDLCEAVFNEWIETGGKMPDIVEVHFTISDVVEDHLDTMSGAEVLTIVAENYNLALFRSSRMDELIDGINDSTALDSVFYNLAEYLTWYLESGVEDLMKAVTK